MNAVMMSTWISEMSTKYHADSVLDLIWKMFNALLDKIDTLVWGVPLIVLILAGGIYLSIRLGLLQIRRLPLALK